MANHNPYIRWIELPDKLKQLQPNEIALWLFAQANEIENSFDNGFPLEAMRKAGIRADCLRSAAKELDNK